MMNSTSRTARTEGRAGIRPRFPRWLAALGLTLTLGACDSLLDVENPNNVLQEEVETPRSVSALVNGAHQATARAVSTGMRASATLTDELDWVGSWNAAGALEQGDLGSSSNDFTNTTFNDLAVARWLSDESIRLLEDFEAEGESIDREMLARAYFYAGVSYATYADLYEDVAFSNREEAGAPVGEENMVQVYDSAVSRLTSAIQIAGEVGDDDLVVAATAMRARAHWARALWPLFNPPGQIPDDVLIDDADANADAAAVLDAVGGTDWKFQFGFNSNTIDNPAAFWVNSRLEMKIGSRFAEADSTGKKICMPSNSACPEEGIVYEDPIDGGPAPALRDVAYEFVEGVNFSPLTVVTEREMHLILAEAALASGSGEDAAVMHINHVRAMDEVTEYDPDTHAQTVVEMLRHERLSSLFLQAQRRMADMYRFGEVESEWSPSAEARTAPGTFFPIGEQERLSNCHILGTC